MKLSSKNLGGRLCNHFFRDIAIHLIAMKYNLDVEYSCEEEFNKLGLIFFKGSKNYDTTKETLYINDSNYMDIYNKLYEDKNIMIDSQNSNYFQTIEISKIIFDYVNREEIKKKIIEMNKYKERYNANDDVFIHVRLGDVEQHTHGFEYYDRALSQIVFKNGYISSDTINHNICQELIKKYNLNIFQNNEIETIMFANTCKYIVLSHGTFSHVSSLFSYYTDKVFYPNYNHLWANNILIHPKRISIDKI